MSSALLLMVSGGSDSMALLEKYAHEPNCKVLHINHMLRGAESDRDEAFVLQACHALKVPVEVRRVHVQELYEKQKNASLEVVAREIRYNAAYEVLDAWCVECGCGPNEGYIYTAHTLDDRIETFYMRSLVGTGPGGLASIPQKRGRIARPLLDYLREDLRNYLRERYPEKSDEELWCEDSTNEDGSNFRSRIRLELMPVLRNLRPHFEQSLLRTMNLIEQEDEYQLQEVQKTLLLNFEWLQDGGRIPCKILLQNPKPFARRILREALLQVCPHARLESTQIERVLNGCGQENFCTEVDSGIKVKSRSEFLYMLRPVR